MVTAKKYIQGQLTYHKTIYQADYKTIELNLHWLGYRDKLTRLEDSPRLHRKLVSDQNTNGGWIISYNSTQDLCNLQRNNRLCGKENPSKPNNQSQTRHDRITIPKALRNPSINEKTDNFAYISTLHEKG
jgi:hypothetical protein